MVRSLFQSPQKPSAEILPGPFLASIQQGCRTLDKYEGASDFGPGSSITGQPLAHLETARTILWNDLLLLPGYIEIDAFRGTGFAHYATVSTGLALIRLTVGRSFELVCPRAYGSLLVSGDTD